MSVSKVIGTAGNDASKRFLGTINKLQSKKKCLAVSFAVPQLQRALGTILILFKPALRLLQLCFIRVKNISLALSLGIV